MFSITELIIFGPIGIFAWVLGSKDLAAMKAGTMDPSGRDITQVGYVLGIVGSILSGLALALVCLWFVFFFMILGAAAGGR